MSSLYILEIKLSSKVSMANIFSYTAGSLSILMLFSLAVGVVVGKWRQLYLNNNFKKLKKNFI